MQTHYAWVGGQGSDGAMDCMSRGAQGGLARPAEESRCQHRSAYLRVMVS